MKRFLLTLVFLLSFVSLAQAEEESLITTGFQEAVTASSPLVPATKPLDNQTPYLKTSAYLGLKKYTEVLEGQVKKKTKYSAATTKKVKAEINKKLAATLEAIKKRRSTYKTKIEKLAEQRLDSLYEVAQRGYEERAEVIETRHGIQLQNANSFRQRYIAKAKAQTRKAIRKAKRIRKAAKRKAAVRKASAGFKKRKAAVIRKHKELVRASNKAYNEGTARNDAIFDQEASVADTTVTNERNASIKALDAAVDKDISYRAAIRARVQKAINFLSSNTAGKVGENSADNKPTGDKNVGKSAAEKAKARAEAKRKAKAKAEAKRKAALAKRKAFCKKNPKSKRCKSSPILPGGTEFGGGFSPGGRIG